LNQSSTTELVHIDYYYHTKKAQQVFQKQIPHIYDYIRI